MIRCRFRLLRVLLGCLVAGFLSVSGCGSENVVGPNPHGFTDPTDLAPLARELVNQAGWPWNESATSTGIGPIVREFIHEVEREVIVDDIVHYSVILPTGPGPFDKIGLHRVVRESRPHHPVRTHKSVFMVHGDGANFEAAFLSATLSQAIPDDQALPVFLAMNNIDVWGIDAGWTLVPEGTADFSFMADWGFQREADDLRVALGVARLARRMTGSGFTKMDLLGWSRGVWTGYTYLNMETQIPPGLRHVKGFIPVEGYFKTNNEETRQLECSIADVYQELIDAGKYQDEAGAFVLSLAGLAKTAPDDPSPIPGFEGLTNLQVALLVGAQTFLLGGGPTPFYHIVAGEIDGGVPSGLQFTQVDHFLDFLLAWAPYQPARIILETSVISCDEADLPYDDHLSDISVPVFYLGAGGGFSDRGLYSLSLLGSSDVSSLVIEIEPDPFLDFGHADIFLADNAEVLAWPPILAWIEGHEHGPGPANHRERIEVSR